MMAKVLVVDDDQMVCRAVAKLLTRSGYDVRTAHDAAPALAMTIDWTPDAALVDLNMPTPGLELVAQLRAKFGPDLFVAMLTGEDRDGIREECQGRGANDVIVKPCPASELRRVLMAAAS
jgi:DNA-binding response OmpR family regulator